MADSIPNTKAVAPLLRENYEYYRGESVDIVEWPDVGELVVPESIVEILDEATSVMLHYCLIHHAKAVRLTCDVSKHGGLKLEVTAEQLQSIEPGRYKLLELSLWASRFGGEFVFGGDVNSDDTASNFFLHLHLPIST